MLHKIVSLLLLATICPLLSMDAPPSAKVEESQPIKPLDSKAEAYLLEIFLKLPDINDKGNTPLHLAAAVQEAPNLLEQLLQKKPDLKNYINSYNHQGYTPLLLALKKGSDSGIITLVKHGANPKLDSIAPKSK